MFASSLLIEFRKPLTDGILSEINEMIIEYNHPSDQPSGGRCRDDKGLTIPSVLEEDGTLKSGDADIECGLRPAEYLSLIVRM